MLCLPIPNNRWINRKARMLPLDSYRLHKCCVISRSQTHVPDREQNWMVGRRISYVHLDKICDRQGLSWAPWQLTNTKMKERKWSSCHTDQDQLLPDVPVYTNASAAESESSGTHDHQMTHLTLKATNGWKPALSKAWQVLDMSHE